ncbi:hypothetical protein NHX12_024823 [Muraenolepis orangiensis]|uniref:Integrin beta n=1 Tax=Muraenolepis orangiensis TaxID=630683 RepID=A0A9Q0ENX4_9TELE|nr:hypothetical protein NHX12_024823 [Muraenolepis orangiensis]
MGRWTLRLSLGLGLFVALLVDWGCADNENYCLLPPSSTCSSCLRSGVGCAYCTDETYERPRCDQHDTIKKGCSAAGIITAHSGMSIEQKERIDVNLDQAQVTPQQMTMSFLPGEKREMDMEVFAPIKGPLDLYILMDFSNSMSDDLANLKRMGTELGNLVKDMSDDYTIGFGKFVDKVVEPQTDMRPAKLEKPWPNSDPPFSFKNVIKLTGDVQFFNSELQKELISGNLDAPEGGFDAILQTTVCEEQIGWRRHSTHLLVFSTESAFHYEADGANVLSGILPRNDELCHLDTSGMYTKDTQQDYPSVPTLVRLMGKHNIIPIFAVTNHSYEYYQKLHTYFPIAEVGKLQEDSANILKIMENAFQAKFQYSNGTVAKDAAFRGKFKVLLQAERMVDEQHVCNLKDDDKVGTMRVKPTTFSKALNIKAEVLCPTCGCEKTPSLKAPRCTNQGNLVCGRCQCDDGWLGPFCNCSTTQSSLGATRCLEFEGKEPCSGRGDCLCGTCVCSEPSQFEGPYCQYDKSQCPRYGGFLCNDRGSCLKEQCECSLGWEGPACECAKGNLTCIDSKGGICNGQGRCVCGRCECLGSTFAQNPTCEANFEAWKTGEQKDKSEDVSDSCEFRDEDDDCTYSYTVDNHKTNAEVEVQIVPLEVSCRKVGFKDDEFNLRQSLLTSDHLDTPMVRTGPPKGIDLVRWKVTDNVHREPNHPEAQSSSLCPCLNEVYKKVPGAPKVQKTSLRMQRNAGKRKDNVIVDSILSAPRASYSDIVEVTQKTVQSGKFQDLKVMPGYFTVATDREATGAVEFQDGVELVDVHVPLFAKDEDDDMKKLRVELVDVPIGKATIAKRFVNITITKEQAQSVFTFLQPAYVHSRQDGVVHIPVNREITDDGPSLVSYITRDNTAKDKQDYRSVNGDLRYGPGETQKLIGIQLLELGEKASLLENKQVKQFFVDLYDPEKGAKLGRYPRTTVTIADEPEPSVFTFKKATHSFLGPDTSCSIPVVRTRNLDVPASVKWRTKHPRLPLSGSLKFVPGQTEKNIVIDRASLPPGPAQLELYDPSSSAVLGERPTTTVNGGDGAPKSPDMVQLGFISQKSSSSPGGLLSAPPNAKAKATGPKTILASWDPPPGNPAGYKVKYWIYGNPEQDAKVMDVKGRQAELRGLYPNCDYEMRVCAYNALGDDAGGHPTVTQVSWGEPAEANGNITAYEVVYTPVKDDMTPAGAAKLVKIDNPKKRMLLIENLQRAQTYMYKVRAKNSVGWSPYRDATINLASQPTRPLSIPIIPDIPIVDAQAGCEYDNLLMYSNEMPKTPSGWQHVQLVGSRMDLRNVSWKRDVEDLIPRRGAGTSTDLDTSSDEAPPPSSSSTCTLHPGSFSDQGRWDQNFIYPGSSMGAPTSPGGVVMRKPSVNRYGDEHIRDSIIMGDIGGRVPDLAKLVCVHFATSRARAESYEVNDALRNLDSVLHDSRVNPGVPDTPTRLVFSALGPTALRVSWQEPYCERDILGYSVFYQLLNGGEVKRINVSSTEENSVVVQDLLPNHSYLFKVKAQSQEGWGPEREGVITIESAVDPKSPLSPMPGSPFTLSTPSAPGPLVFTALSPEALQLSWEEPRKPNGDILGYVVTCEQLHGGGDVRSFQVPGDSAETSLTVSDLSENMPYKFKVQAKTTQGFGPEREGIITIESQDGGEPDALRLMEEQLKEKNGLMANHWSTWEWGTSTH